MRTTSTIRRVSTRPRKNILAPCRNATMDVYHVWDIIILYNLFVPSIIRQSSRGVFLGGDTRREKEIPVTCFGCCKVVNDFYVFEILKIESTHLLINDAIYVVGPVVGPIVFSTNDDVRRSKIFVDEYASRGLQRPRDLAQEREIGGVFDGSCRILKVPEIRVREDGPFVYPDVFSGVFAAFSLDSS